MGVQRVVKENAIIYYVSRDNNIIQRIVICKAKDLQDNI